MKLDMAALDCDFYVFSAHKLYGPTGIGVLWARPDILDGMPPWQGGGAMIDQVPFAHTSYAPPPPRFEAGTPPTRGAIGLPGAVDYEIGCAKGRTRECRVGYVPWDAGSLKKKKISLL